MGQMGKGLVLEIEGYPQVRGRGKDTKQNPGSWLCPSAWGLGLKVLCLVLAPLSPPHRGLSPSRGHRGQQGPGWGELFWEQKARGAVGRGCSSATHSWIASSQMHRLENSCGLGGSFFPTVVGWAGQSQMLPLAAHLLI
jgi:hypothetical protein